MLVISCVELLSSSLFEVNCLSDSDVKSSRPKCLRGQNFGLGLKDLALVSASASKLWPRPRPRPRPQTFGFSLASILSHYVIGHFGGKNRVKFTNFVNFSVNNLKSYVVNRYLVLFS